MAFGDVPVSGRTAVEWLHSLKATAYLLGFSKGRDFGPRATGDVKLKVVALHLVHQVIA